MSLAEELRQIQELHQSGALTDEEFARAKDKALAAGEPDAGRADALLLRRRLEHLEHQNEIDHQGEIERLDRDWRMEREIYMAAGRNGIRTLPDKFGGLLFAAIFCGTGLFWIVSSGAAGNPDSSPAGGFIFITAGAASAANAWRKAERYERAHRRYQQRRAALLARHGG